MTGKNITIYDGLCESLRNSEIVTNISSHNLIKKLNIFLINSNLDNKQKSELLDLMQDIFYDVT